jgi:hypothetical protein
MKSKVLWNSYLKFREQTPAHIFNTPADLFCFHVQQGCLALHASLHEYFQEVLLPEWPELRCQILASLSSPEQLETSLASLQNGMSRGQLLATLSYLSLLENPSTQQWKFMDLAILLTLAHERAFESAGSVQRGIRELAASLLSLDSIEAAALSPAKTLSLREGKEGLQRIDHFRHTAPSLHPVWRGLESSSEEPHLKAA